MCMCVCVCVHAEEYFKLFALGNGTFPSLERYVANFT